MKNPANVQERPDFGRAPLTPSAYAPFELQMKIKRNFSKFNQQFGRDLKTRFQGQLEGQPSQCELFERYLFSNAARSSGFKTPCPARRYFFQCQTEEALPVEHGGLKRRLWPPPKALLRRQAVHHPQARQTRQTRRLSPLTVPCPRQRVGLPRDRSPAGTGFRCPFHQTPA